MSAILTASPTLLLEADALTGLVDGDSVASWGDGSGNGRDATQATPSARPVYKAGVAPSGLPAVRFNGTSTRLGSAASASAAAQSVVAVIRVAGTGDRAFRGFAGDPKGGLTFRVNNDRTFGADRGGLDNIANSVILPPDGWHLAVLTYSQAISLEMRIDGQRVAAVTPSAPAFTAGLTTSVGSYNAVNGWFNGDIATLATWDRVLTNAEINAIEAELSAKWGLPKPKGNITGSSNYSSSWPVERLFDGVVDDPPYAWNSSGAAPQWVRVEFPEPRAVATYTISARPAAYEQSPRDWILYGSDDASTWVAVDTQTAQSFTASQSRTYSVGTPAPYRYYRLSVSATSGGSYVAFAELAFTFTYLDAKVPTAALTFAAPTPAIASPPVAGPTAALGLAAPTPAVVVAAPTAALVLSAPTPTLPGVLIAVPTAALDLSALAPSLPIVGLAADLLAASSLDVGAVILPPLVVGPFTLGAASTLTVDPSGIFTITPTVGAVLDAGSMFRLALRRDWGPDPRTGVPQTRVVIVTRDGTPVLEPRDVTIAPLKQGVGVIDSWSFRVPREVARRIHPVEHEAQWWRGNVMLTRGPIGPDDGSGGSNVTFPVSDPRWLLARRVIGRIPKKQLLRNADFTQGLAYWQGAWDDGSALAAPPTAKVVDEPEAASGKALVMGAPDKVVTTKVDVQTSAVFVPNQATYLSGGEQKIRDVGAGIPNGAVVRITGFTANDGTGNGLALSLARAQAARGTLAAMGKGFIFKLPDPLRSPNLHDATVAGRGYYEQIPGGLAANRRVSIAFEGTVTAVGHRQYERAYANITQPVAEKVPLTVVLAGRMKIIEWLGAPKDGWALRLILHPAGDLSDGAIVEDSTATMDELTPRVRWAPYQVSVDVPADGQPYVLEVRLYPPAGSSAWKDVSLCPEEQIGLFGVDQALHIKRWVEHAQDTTMGHGDLGIGTRTPLTGVPRTVERRFSERMPVPTQMDWYQSIANGLEIDCETTPTTATIVTHYPRQGSISDLALVHGRKSNVAAYRQLSPSGRDLASSIIMQADGSGASRPEGYARDAAALGGTLLEQVVSAEDETPLGELDEAAVVALAQSVSPRPGWEVTIDPKHTSDVLDRVHKGDTVRLQIGAEGIDGLHRVVASSLDPDTDTLTLTLTVEG